MNEWSSIKTLRSYMRSFFFSLSFTLFMSYYSFLSCDFFQGSDFPTSADGDRRTGEKALAAASELLSDISTPERG